MLSNLLENNTLPHSEKEVLAELNCILSSTLFSRASVLSNFLKFIVEETLDGRANGLKEYTIGVYALGKSADFNPQIDAIVRIHAGRLRRLLNEYYTGSGLTDPIKIEVVKGTYIPVFRPHLIDMPNENPVKVERPIQFSRSKLTLAVLPFRNLCPDNEYQFFADGFGEELTRIFSSWEDIDVVAHYSTRKYASNPDDIRVIGSDLGVHYLICGSVKRTSKDIRVSVGLMETLNGLHIWTKNYIHNLEIDKIIDIQDQVNDDVFAILGGHYGYIVRDTMNIGHSDDGPDLASFDAILWNYHAQMTHSLKACLTTGKALEKALRKNPDNVMCLIVLGDLYLYSYSLGYPTIEDPVNTAYRFIKKAVGLAPLSQYAHIIYGWANIYLGKKEEAIKAIDYSIQLAPLSASTSGTIGFGLACLGEYKRAHGLLRGSLDLNPYCPWWHHMGFFFVYYHNGDYKMALRHAQKMNASEDVFLGPLLKTAAKGQLGLISEAQREVQILKQKFQPILADLKIHLETFLHDKYLIDRILKGVKMGGLSALKLPLLSFIELL